MFRFEIALFLLLGTYATEDITDKRKNILKELSVIVLNGFHFCHSAANYSRGTQEDVIRFWEPNYPLQHTEFGCAAMCVTIVLHLANNGGDINLRSAAAFLKYKGAGFMKALEECRHELNFSDHVIRDLYFYWKEDYTLLNRETGCAIVCMSHKLNLLDTSGKIHHGNAKEFAMSHGAVDDTAAKLVTALHECESKNVEVEDSCMKALEVAKCFRTAIDQLNWTPSMNVVLTEVLTDI